MPRGRGLSLVPAPYPTGFPAPSLRQRPRAHWPILGLSIVDRYFASTIFVPLAASLGVIVMLLLLENTPRLIILMADVDRPVRLIISSMEALLPEYLAIGLLVAIYLSIALAIRRLAMLDELGALWASGMSNASILKVPIFVALLGGVLVLGLRGYVQPWGERRLDAIGIEIRTGDHGIRLRPGVITRLSDGGMLSMDRVLQPGRLSRVFVHLGPMAFAANSAKLSFATGDQLLLHLADGNFARQGGDGRWLGAGQFRALTVAIPVEMPPSHPKSIQDRIDRRSLSRLLIQARGGESGLAPHREQAKAAIEARGISALFCLFLPFLALPLAIPPKRSRSAIGLFVGIVLIIGFIRASTAIEAQVSGAAINFALLLAAYGFACWLLMRATAREAGSIEGWLNATARRAIALLGRSNR